ncbi:hypothetical protein CAPTEDRAFT_204151 [Capitella teleta]|uniref:Uncharacterized protein n=1 Tax=Capitella teleta TaxID=283909 RepID=R7U5E5_CAPTE|nr:hypothetical protein CAPTEDRAFT_204151 [Capitella teleta]|eukprot:ELU01590.1 hypothetical protein CAPTEDRAFT_204151 [Capitella teleta]
MIKSDVLYIDRNLRIKQPKEQSFLIGRPAKHIGSQSVPRLRESSSLRLFVCLHVICLLSIQSVGASRCDNDGRYYFYDEHLETCLRCIDVCADPERWGTTFECRTYCPNWPHSTSTSPRMITTSAPHSTETLDNGLKSPVNADGPSYGVTIGVSCALLLILMVEAVAVVCYIIWNKSAKKKRENHMDNPQSTTCQPLKSVQATGIPESPAAEEAEGNFRRESFVFATDLNTSTVSINVWPGAEDFFRNFHVREENDFRGIPAGENASRVSEFNRNIEVKVLAEPQNISSDEPSETDSYMTALEFVGTSASIEVKDLEKEMIPEQKLQLIEELN